MQKLHRRDAMVRLGQVGLGALTLSDCCVRIVWRLAHRVIWSNNAPVRPRLAS